MPSNGHGLGFAADVLRHDDGVNGISGQGDGEVEVGLREPVAAEVAGVNDARDFFAAVDVLFGYVVGFGLQYEAVHGMTLCTGILADIVCRQGDGVALPLCGEGLAVGRELAANAIGIGHEERRAEPVGKIPIGVVFIVEHFLSACQVRRGEDVDVSATGEVGGDLEQFHAAPRHDRDAGEFRPGLAGDSARESDNLLAADLGGCLGLSAHDYPACHNGQKKEGNNTAAKRRLHLNPSLKRVQIFRKRFNGREFPADVSVFRKRPHSTTSDGGSREMNNPTLEFRMWRRCFWLGDCPSVSPLDLNP